MSSKPGTWQKGQSGNLNGRPHSSWRDVFEKATNKRVSTKDGKKVVIKEALANAMIGEALKGDVQAFNAITNRMEGMPPQSIEAKNEGTYNIDINGIIGLPETSTQTKNGDPDPTEPAD